MSPFQLVYGVDVVFPTSLGVLVMKLFQETEVEPNDMHKRINQMIQLQQTRQEIYSMTQLIQDKIKKIHHKRIKDDDFDIDDVVLKWDARNKGKGKHKKI